MVINGNNWVTIPVLINRAWDVAGGFVQGKHKLLESFWRPQKQQVKKELKLLP